MTNAKEHTGTMTLTSITAVAVWNAAVRDQITGQMWRAARPHGHADFWAGLTVRHGRQNRIVHSRNAVPVKNKYALTRIHLLQDEKGGRIYRKRLLSIGRIVRAGADPLQSQLLRAAEDMPDSFEDFIKAKKNGRFRSVSAKLARQYYDTEYKLHDLTKISC